MTKELRQIPLQAIKADPGQPRKEFATTLTFADKRLSELWEPAAASPAERVTILRHAHGKGIYTWVSLEPVIDPRQTLELIKQTHMLTATK